MRDPNGRIPPATLGAEAGDPRVTNSAPTERAGHVDTTAVLDQIEAATRGVEEAIAGDLEALRVVMSVRSEAAMGLRRLLAQMGRDLNPEEQKRVAAILRRGSRFREQLLVRRAALRSKMQQLTTGDRMVRRLRPEQTSGLRLNCRG